MIDTSQLKWECDLAVSAPDETTGEDYYLIWAFEEVSPGVYEGPLYIGSIARWADVQAIVAAHNAALQPATQEALL